MGHFLTWTWGRAVGAGGTGGGIASPPLAQKVKEGHTWCWNRGKWVIVSGWLTSPRLVYHLFYGIKGGNYWVINNKQKQQKKKGAHQTLPQWKNIPWMRGQRRSLFWVLSWLLIVFCSLLLFVCSVFCLSFLFPGHHSSLFCHFPNHIFHFPYPLLPLSSFFPLFFLSVHVFTALSISRPWLLIVPSFL